MWTKITKAIGIICLIFGAIGSIWLAIAGGGFLSFIIGAFATLASVCGLMIFVEISEHLERCEYYLSKLSSAQTPQGLSYGSSSPPLRSANTMLNLSDIGKSDSHGRWTCKKCGEPNSNGSRVCKGCGESRY